MEKESYTAAELAATFREIRADEAATKGEDADWNGKEAFKKILDGKTEAPAVEKGKDKGMERWCSMTVEEKLEKIEALLTVLVERQQVREWYSVEEFARIVGRAEFTCREWCRLGRILAEKKDSGRGAHASWAISHAELLRFQKDGLRPLR